MGPLTAAGSPPPLRRPLLPGGLCTRRAAPLASEPHLVRDGGRGGRRVQLGRQALLHPGELPREAGFCILQRSGPLPPSQDAPLGADKPLWVTVSAPVPSPWLGQSSPSFCEESWQWGHFSCKGAPHPAAAAALTPHPAPRGSLQEDRPARRGLAGSDERGANLGLWLPFQ